MAQIPIKIYGGAKKPLQVIFTSSQTYTIPSGYKSMDVFVVGGGGGGGSCGGKTTGQSYSVNLWAGAGGGGGYTQTYKKVAVSQKDISVTIGGGGAKGATGYWGSTHFYLITTAVGGDGGKTSVIVGGNEYSANGGYGDKHSAAAGEAPTLSNSVWSGSGGTGGATGSNYFGSGAGTGHTNGLSAGSNGANGSAYNSGKPRWYAGQGSTTKTFGEADGTVYAGGGKGGDTRNYTNASSTFGYGGAGGTGRGTNMGGGGAGLDVFGEMSSVTVRYGSGSNGDAGKAIIRLYPNTKRPEITWDSSNTISL